MSIQRISAALLFLLIAICGATTATATIRHPRYGITALKPVRTVIATPKITTRPYIVLARRVPRGIPRQKPATAKTGRVAAALQAQSGSRVLSRGCSATGQPAPIVALVSGLKCDPDLIYEWVYNNIEYEPLYGSNKGALGTLLDRRGDDADQAILFVTLLNAAGYQQTGYINVGLIMQGSEISSWLGVPNDCNAIQYMLDGGGIPYAQDPNNDPICNADGTLNEIEVLQFYAGLQFPNNNTWYFFDPSFKYHNVENGVTNLPSIMGYSQAAFLSDVGGTLSGGPNNNSEFVGLNRSQLRGDLTSYAQNLVKYAGSSSVQELIGGKTIIPLTGSPIRFAPGWTPTTSFPQDCPNQSPTLECRSFVTFTMNGNQGGTPPPMKLYSDQIYGHRATITSATCSFDYCMTFLIDGAPPSCVPTCGNVGIALVEGQTAVLAAEYTEPNQPADPNCPSGDTDCGNLNVTVGGTYVFSQAFGSVGRGMAEYHRQLLNQALAQGNSNTSEIVQGESLATISYNWMAELTNVAEMTGRFTQSENQYHFAGGITGLWNIQQHNYQGPYVDLPINYFYEIPWSSSGPNTNIGNYSYPTARVAAGMSMSEASSALESAVLLQTQAQISNMTAASTAMLVDQNMSPGNTETIFYADPTTVEGQDFFYFNINPAIQNMYSASDFTNIQAAVQAGELVLIPENGSQSVGGWTGAGYTTIATDSLGFLVVNKITGGMSGGFSGAPDPYPSEYVPLNLTPYASSDTLPVTINLTPSQFDSMFAEPVDSVTGAYTYTHDDLVVGGDKFPYALPFTRTYISADGTNLTTPGADIGMGNGWASNYNITAQTTSDPYIGMALADSPAVPAATSIASLYVMQDLQSVTPTTQTATIGSMIAKWYADQITNNVVQISKPSTTEEYVALPRQDGATTINFTPPPGTAVRLTETGSGAFQYLTKDGIALNFAQVKTGATQSSIQNWVYPDGMEVDLSYDNGLLTEVTNNLGRSLKLSYDANNDVESVADDTGRSVIYHFDANRNLIKFTDPLNYSTTFSYDTSGALDAWGHLTRVFYPANPGNPFVTNAYDPMGHVSTQANANGYVTNFFITDSRSQFVDPLGNVQVTYQTDRGRVIKQAVVLNNGALNGNVYNDTIQANGVVNVTTNQYDALDRLTLSTAPEGDSVAVTYSLSNAWANNVASITKNPKPLSSLQPITETFFYDQLWNKVVKTIDGLGLVTTNFYDESNGNLIESIANAGGLGATSTFTYNSHGQILTATDPVGVLTKYGYDDQGNQTSVTRDYGNSGHLNQLTQMGYDDLGDLASVIDPNSNETTQEFDADRRRKTVITPPAPEQLVTAYTYDKDGNLLNTTQSANGSALRTTSSTYTLTDKVLTNKDANGNITTYGYDPDDRLASTSDPYLVTTSYGYDAASREISVSNTAVQAAPLLQKAYEPDGPLAGLTDANANTTAYTYDGLNRLKKTTYPAVSGSAATEKYTYDADNNVLSFTSRGGDVLSYAYDGLNRLCSKAIASTATLCTASSSSNPTTWYTHDLDGRLAQATDNSSATIHAAATGASYTENLAYDALNHPLTVNWSPAAAAPTPTTSSVTFNYGYDRNNRRISQNATDKSWWSYPTAAENVSYTTNTLNQYTTVGSLGKNYNADGDLTLDGSFTYGYDAENRMTSAALFATGQNVATYTYDALGRRNGKTIASSGTTTIYVADPDGREVLEYDGTSGATNAWYAYGPGPNDVLSRNAVATSGRTTLIPDIQGSIVGQLNTSGLPGVIKTGYQSFGENTVTVAGNFRYTGQRFDAETASSSAEPSGLYYYRTRMYSPTLGRFLQPDTIGYQGGPGGLNLYAYVGNDPLDATDPYGQSGFGLLYGGSFEMGQGLLGFGLAGSAAGGVFWGGQQGVNLGGYGSAGAFAGVPPLTNGSPINFSYPEIPPGGTTSVIGAYAGAGLGLFWTNATSAAGLAGPFNTYSINTPIGSWQYGVSGSTYVESITCGIPICGGIGGGGSASTFPTTTESTGAQTLMGGTSPAGGSSGTSTVSGNDLESLDTATISATDFSGASNSGGTSLSLPPK